MKEGRQADRKSKQKIASILVPAWSTQCVSGQPRSFLPHKKRRRRRRKRNKEQGRMERQRKEYRDTASTKMQ